MIAEKTVLILQKNEAFARLPLYFLPSTVSEAEPIFIKVVSQLKQLSWLNKRSQLTKFANQSKLESSELPSNY